MQLGEPGTRRYLTSSKAPVRSWNDNHRPPMWQKADSTWWWTPCGHAQLVAKRGERWINEYSFIACYVVLISRVGLPSFSSFSGSHIRPMMCPCKRRGPAVSAAILESRLHRWTYCRSITTQHRDRLAISKRWMYRCHGLRLYPVCVCNTVRLGQDTTWNRRVPGTRFEGVSGLRV